MKRAGYLSSLFIGVLLIAMPSSADAQVSVGVGYQAVHLPENWVTSGFNVDVARDVSSKWSAVGEFGLAHEGAGEDVEGFNLYNVGGGIRWNPTRSGPTPFAQALAGVQVSTASIDSDTAFMLQVGGGVHLPINDRWGAVAQVDYRPVFYQEETVNEVRFVIGARWSR